jgi:hypothetical protein
MGTQALAATQSAAQPTKELFMYIGAGTLVVILLIVMIIYFLRRA